MRVLPEEGKKMTVQQWFRIYNEFKAKASEQDTVDDRVIRTTFTEELVVMAVNRIYEEEKKDARTEAMNDKSVKMITDKQKRVLEEFGYANINNITRQQASELISREIESRREKK